MDRDKLYNPGEEIIETERLIMRRLRPEDYLAMAAWDMDERVYKYLMSTACKTPEEPLAWLPKKDPKSKINILMLVLDKEDGHAVGTYALNHVVERDVWTLSYVNRFDDWGKGYTTEGMKAFMDHAVKVYGAHSFEGECAKENVGSGKVLQKLGMVYDHSSSYSKNDGSATFESDIYVLKIEKKIFWAGDSTVAFNHIDSYPQTGIGQVFNLFLPEGFEVRDYAVNGRSTKSFIDEGRLKKIDQEIRENDFLFIQFGHNDEKEQDPTRYAAPFGAYRDNLRLFIEVARSHKAQPVLITPLERRNFDPETGLIIPSHGEYPAAMMQVAAEEKVPCIDLNRSSRELMNSLGNEASKEFFVHVPAGKYAAFPEGKSDNTHLQYHGAVTFAGLIAKELSDNGILLQLG